MRWILGGSDAQIASYDNSSHDRHDHDRYVELQDFHSQQSFDPSIVALATFLCTFNIGQYFSFVVVRWEARFDNLWQSNSLIKAVQLEALTWCRKGNEAYRPTVEIPRLLRLLHLMNHVVHMELGRYNKLGEREWAVLEGRGLITKEERQILEQMRHKDQTVAAWCFEQASSFSLHGACDEHTAKSVLAGNIQQAYKYGTKQNAYELMNVPCKPPRIEPGSLCTRPRTPAPALTFAEPESISRLRPVLPDDDLEHLHSPRAIDVE